MRRVMMALLATAAAALPVSVSAQDDGERGERRPRMENRSDEGRPARERVRAEAPSRGDDSRRFERPERPDRPAPAVQVEAQARVDRNRGNGGWDRRRPEQPAAQAPAAPQPVPVEARRNRGFADSVFGRDVDRARDGRRDDARGRDRNDGRNWTGNERRDGNRNDGRWDGRRDDNRNDGRWNDGRRDDNRWNDGRWNDGRWNDNTRNWNRGWRSDRRYDWQRYRSYNRNAFRLPRYIAPYSWHYGYRRQSIGAYLFAGLFAQNYWIGDPWEYRLPPVEWPYRWVRYYDDALLVDTETGRVVDVIEGIFWY